MSVIDLSKEWPPYAASATVELSAAVDALGGRPYCLPAALEP